MVRPKWLSGRTRLGPIGIVDHTGCRRSERVVGPPQSLEPITKIGVLGRLRDAWGSPGNPPFDLRGVVRNDQEPAAQATAAST